MSPKSYYNETEVDIVTTEVQRLLDTGIPAREIGVISPYSGQVGKIRAGLASVTGDTAALQVSTVDAFQGSEREAIIVSFVRSNDQGYSGFLTFPEVGPSRLNVALTRAKRRLVLVGDFTTLSTPAPGTSQEHSAADVYGELRMHLEDCGAFSPPPI